MDASKATLPPAGVSSLLGHGLWTLAEQTQGAGCLQEGPSLLRGEGCLVLATACPSPGLHPGGW